MNIKTTMRLVIPEWHGGVNPNYVLGSEFLAHIVPQSDTDKTVYIPVDTNFDEKLNRIDGIDGGDLLLKQMSATKKALDKEQPDKVIVFGGDCSVTQVPFDYLHGKYGTSLGIIWLDAHPDISNTTQSTHLHEMVLANLLDQNPTSSITRVHHPFTADKVILAGLIEERLREMDRACKELDITIISPEELQKSNQKLIQWIKDNHLEQIAIHWDLDVLSPVDFRSIYPAEPYADANVFPAAVGRMTLKEVGKLFSEVSSITEIVGLSITEHLPWDAINFRKTLAAISIFNC